MPSLVVLSLKLSKLQRGLKSFVESFCPHLYYIFYCHSTIFYALFQRAAVVSVPYFSVRFVALMATPTAMSALWSRGGVTLAGRSVAGCIDNVGI